MNTKDSIMTLIRKTVSDVTGISDFENDTSLIDGSLPIAPVNFVYIFNALEKTLNLPVHDILKDHTFNVMTVENLADAILALTPTE
jgi:hypothetical protein